MYTVTNGKPTNDQPPTTTTVSGCRPGSDINVTGYEITSLGTSHLLTFNKFPAARPHMLLLTQDGFRRQHERLDRDDLAAMWATINTLNNSKKRYLAFYNCGFESGCSRLHKHMQVFPAPDAGTFTLWPDHEENKFRRKMIPFKYSMFRYEKDWSATPGGLLEIYQELLRQAEEDLVSYTTNSISPTENGKKAERMEGAAIPHNVIMNRDWMVVIPRRAGGWDGATGNAPAMLGMVWLPSVEKMNRWIELGPCEVLGRMGVPAPKE